MATNVLTRFHRSVRQIDGVALAISLMLLGLDAPGPLLGISQSGLYA
jgi:hypothetical protein